MGPVTVIIYSRPQYLDKHGNVTVFSLVNYVYNAILNLPEDKRPKQKPITKLEGGADISSQTILLKHLTPL